MALIVQKYGGTSVADPDRMRAVAENVSITKRRGNDVVVVVSAMGKATDNLIALASQVSATRPGREMDMLLTTGERVSAALLTMALAGRLVTSWTGDPSAVVGYAARFTRPVVVPDTDDGVVLEVSGTVKAVDDDGGVEGGARIATVAITAAVDGKTVLARATARVRLPA